MFSVLENTQMMVENEIEAELVAKLAVFLREHLSQEEKHEKYPENEESDSAFWKNDLFIVALIMLKFEYPEPSE